MITSRTPYDQGTILTQNTTFAGDRVQLAGQIDYPSAPIPPTGYPLIFILQHAGCTGRHGYDHFARLGTSLGYAVFRWDKRGTGASGGGGTGSADLDAIKAYQRALHMPSVDKQRVTIIAQSEGTLLLSKNYEAFTQEQKPGTIILIGNMLEEEDILKMPVRLRFITGDEDWNNWKRYARSTSQAHSQRYLYPESYYVAQNANRSLRDLRSGHLHSGALSQIREWLAE